MMVHWGVSVLVGLLLSPVAQIRGVTPLMRAAEEGQLPLVKKLVTRRASVSARDSTGSTALLLAIAGRDQPSDAEGEVINRKDRPRERLAIVQLLLKRGARADIGGNAGCTEGAGTKGVTPLMRAIEVGRIDIARVILKHRHTPPLNLDARASDGMSALHYAAKQSTGDGVRLLVAAGAKVNARAPGGMTPLMSAAYAGSPAGVKALLAAGADPNLETREGDTALHLGGDAEVVKLLLSHGARVKMNRAGYSVYTLALWHRQKDLITLLKSHNPPTGFFDALLLSDLPAVKDWLARGGNPNGEFINEWPLLHVATQLSSADVVRALLEAGAKVDAKAGFAERTALLAALVEETGEPQTADEEARRMAVVRALLDAGASVAARDNRRNTPLILAAKRNSMPLVKLLVEKGAAADEQDVEGLALTSPHVSKEIMDLLRSKRKQE